MPARLIGRKPTGGMAETLLLRRREDVDPLGHVWECLVNPGKRLKPGAVIEYRAGGPHAPADAPVVLTGEVLDFVPESRGGRLVRFTPEGADASGEPAHARRRHPRRGACAAAALHHPVRGRPREVPDRVRHEGGALRGGADGGACTSPPSSCAASREKGARFAAVELEVGIDTFRLVEEDDPTQHVMHTER